MMVYSGTFKNGVVVLDGKVELQDGQRVRVDIDVAETRPAGSAVWQELLKLSGSIKSGRRDGSANHDHYISGAPKREPRT
jgi:hypothetical protein